MSELANDNKGDDVASEAPELAFLADTQTPMWVEALFLRQHQNARATAAVFQDLLRRNPATLYWLGDIVALGYQRGNWAPIDKFLQRCREQSLPVRAILGNHDVMGRPKKGMQRFQERFPEHIATGYVHQHGDVAVLLLNSNFSVLTADERTRQWAWYTQTLRSLDEDPTVRAVIVTCHHAPYTYSRLVRPSRAVQETFVPGYLQSQKAKLFITGHAHAFERFKVEGKDFLVIGGGGGLRQPLNAPTDAHPDVAATYKPLFHYLTVRCLPDRLSVCSHRLLDDFSGFADGYGFAIPLDRSADGPPCGAVTESAVTVPASPRALSA